MNHNVIIIGYGVAGRIHKDIYEKKGLKCFIVEKNIQKMEGLNTPHFTNLKKALAAAKEVFFFDICTDTSNHYTIFNEILSLTKKPNIIIEKPIVNKRKDLEDIKRRVKNKELSVFVNENYLFLSSIGFIKKIIQRRGLKNYNIYIEFTKDRTKSKRFLDPLLLSVGIEGTHMLAILDMFLNLNDLTLVKSHCSTKNFFANYSAKNGAHATLYSSLEGIPNFSDKIIEKADKKLRVLKISGKDGNDIVVLFGSSENLTTRIFVMKKDYILEEYTLPDNTMTKSLSYAIKVFEKKKSSITFNKNVLFTEFLLDIVSKS